MAFLVVHNPDWGFNWESQIFFPVLSLIGRLTASHHSSVPCRDASVLQSLLPLDSEKGTYWKFFSEVIIKKNNYSFTLIFRRNFCLLSKMNKRLWGCFGGVGLLWFFPLSFSGSHVSQCAHFFDIFALVHINCLALNKCQQSQSWKLAYLNIDYVSVYKIFLPSNKLFICAVCFRNWTEQIFLKIKDFKGETIEEKCPLT